MPAEPHTASISRIAPAKPETRSLRFAAVGVLLLASVSCIQPPPPRTYNAQVARHLRQLSHDTPVTPVPSTYGWGYYGYNYYGGY